MPEPAPAPDKDAEFGMVMLEDGSAGLYYAWLGESQRGMNERFSMVHLTSLSALELAGYYRSDAEDKCSLGLAAINAITRCVYRHAGYSPLAAMDSLGAATINSKDHVGMVGYFPALVKKLREKQMRLTVLELKSQFPVQDELVQVTLDPMQLYACNKILITASTLLNNTLDDILQYAKHADAITVLGPTAGFFPDPLFTRGVTAVGGTEITDAVTAIQRLRNKQSLGDAARKFLVTRDSYPGFRQLFSTRDRPDQH